MFSGVYLRRPAEGGRGSVGLQAFLAESEVGQDNVALRVQQDVLRLQVPEEHRTAGGIKTWDPQRPAGGAAGSASPVHDVQRVKVAQSAGDLRRVEPGPGLQEDPLPLQVVEELQGTDGVNIRTGPNQAEPVPSGCTLTSPPLT